jgi:beta-glucosidase
MRSYLRSARRAIAEGYPLMGYFHWSLMDNFEWSWGYLRRFGLTRVDYDTLKRTPKLSFHWYQQVIRENRVL